MSAPSIAPPAPDTWRGFLARLSSDEICAIDRMLFEAKR